MPQATDLLVMNIFCMPAPYNYCVVSITETRIILVGAILQIATIGDEKQICKKQSCFNNFLKIFNVPNIEVKSQELLYISGL